MGEALAAVGSAASVVQLLDFGLRLTQEACSFVWAVQDAPKDIRDFTALIDDIRRALEIVRSYVSQQQQALAAQPKLPDALMDGVRHLIERLHAVRKLLPAQPGTGLSLARRVIWVVGSKKFREAFALLDSQKTSVQLQLQVVSLLDGIGQRQQTVALEQRLAQSLQTFVDRYTHDQSTTLDSIDNQGALLRGSFDDQIQSFCDRQDSLQGILGGRLDDLERQFAQGRQRDIQIVGAIQSLRSRIQASTNRLRELHSLNSRLLERVSTIETSVPAIDGDAFAAIVRTEVQNVILSLGNSVFPGRPATHESLARSARGISDQIGKGLLQSETARSNASARSKDDDKTHRDRADLDPNIRPAKTVVQTYRCLWESSGRMGTLIVTIHSTRPVDREFGQRTTVIKAVFRPAAWLPLAGVETSLKLEASHRGFNNIQPGVAWFSILPDQSPVFESTRLGDLGHLQYLLTNGLASPFDQDTKGWTPLHYAAHAGQPDICRYLISEGADLSAANGLVRWSPKGQRPLDVLHFQVSEGILTAPAKERGGEIILQNYMQCCRMLADRTYDSSDTFDENAVTIMGNTFTEDLPIEAIHNEDNYEDHCEYMREWCHFLLQQGVHHEDIHLTTADGFTLTLLHLKAGGTSIQGLYMLVLCGADVNAVTSHGETALALMLRVGLGDLNSRLFREHLRFLLAHGANPLTVDSSGSTPTLNAAKSNLLDEWYAELGNAGYNVMDIIQQSVRLTKEFFIKESRGGISSSLDNIVDRPWPRRRAPRTGVSELGEL